MWSSETSTKWSMKAKFKSWFSLICSKILNLFETVTLLPNGGLVSKSCLTLVTPWTVAHQAPLSMGFSRQEHWSGLSFPSPGDLPNSRIKPRVSCFAHRFLHGRQILCWLSYEGRPSVKWSECNLPSPSHNVLREGFENCKIMSSYYMSLTILQVVF